MNEPVKDKVEERPIRIAPKRGCPGEHWTTEDWNSLRFDTEASWNIAITIFHDRLRIRFLDVAEVIMKMPYAGFSLMALDCLLIETLEQFRRGVRTTPSSESNNYIVGFLTGTSFQEFFDQDMARVFASKIRNGILHQAEVKGSSRIVTTKDVPLARWSEDRDGLVINRTKFHLQLVVEFERYVELLRKKDREMRPNFRRKMHYIANPTRTR